MIQFLESSAVSDAMPMVATPDSLTNLLSKQTVWINRIYDKAKSTVARHNIESTMLQLITSEFITIKHRGDKLYWHINCVKDKHIPWYADDQPLYHNISAWMGISLYDCNRSRRFKAQPPNKTKASKIKNKSKSSKSNKQHKVTKTKRTPKHISK